MTRDFGVDVNKNQREAYLKFADHISGAESRQFGSITGVSTGLPVPVYNQLFAYEAPDYDDVIAGIEWMADRDVPFWLSLPKSIAETDAFPPADLSLVKRETAPGMAMASLEEIPTNDTDAAITTVTNSDALDEFIQVFAEAFEMPEPLAQQANPESMLEDPDIRLLVGRIDGYAVACGQLVKTDDIAGIYAMGVRDDFRGQGVGTAMAWEVLRGGREAGCDVGVLQSSEMAYSLYQRMGFETVTTYHGYVPDA